MKCKVALGLATVAALGAAWWWYWDWTVRKFDVQGP